VNKKRKNVYYIYDNDDDDDEDDKMKFRSTCSHLPGDPDAIQTQ